jgi:hypothetical protein
MLIKSGRMRWEGHMARIGVIKGAEQGFGGETGEKETT